MCIRLHSYEKRKHKENVLFIRIRLHSYENECLPMHSRILSTMTEREKERFTELLCFSDSFHSLPSPFIHEPNGSAKSMS